MHELAVLKEQYVLPHPAIQQHQQKWHFQLIVSVEMFLFGYKIFFVQPFSSREHSCLSFDSSTTPRSEGERAGRLGALETTKYFI